MRAWAPLIVASTGEFIAMTTATFAILGFSAVITLAIALTVLHYDKYISHCALLRVVRLSYYSKIYTHGIHIGYGLIRRNSNIVLLAMNAFIARPSVENIILYPSISKEKSCRS